MCNCNFIDIQYTWYPDTLTEWDPDTLTEWDTDIVFCSKCLILKH